MVDEVEPLTAEEIDEIAEGIIFDRIRGTGEESEFAAKARTLVPRLIATVRALEAELAEAVEVRRLERKCDER